MTLDSILLLSCRSPFLDDSKIYAPMANLYLKSYIEQELPKVRVTLGDDSYDLNNPDYFERYDAIGISIMTPQREEALKILHTIKKRYPEKVVIAGGPHVKHYIGDIIDAREPYDKLVPMDGEKAIVAILREDTEDMNHKYIRTGVKDGRHIVVEELEDPRIINHVMSKEDILNAPRPDRRSIQSVEILRQYKYMLGDKKATTMMCARGCPERCSFCEDAMTPVRWSNLHNIAREMDDIRSIGYQGVYLFDDLFAIAMPQIKPICELLKKKDLIFRCNAQARYFTKWGEEMAKLLADSGCYEIAFGAETGSQKILNNINKRTTI